jgi:ATP-binding cassette subfamily F protein 3
MRKQERTVHELEKTISSLEEELGAMDRLMADPDNIEDQSLFFSYREKREKLDRLMEQWELASAELDKLKAK